MEDELKRNKDIFQETTGFTACLEVLHLYSSVIIVADPGDGKTTLSYGIARHLQTKAWDDGILYTPLFINSPEEWRNYVNPKEQLVVVIDDIFGTHNLSVEIFQKWMTILPNIESCLKENGGMLLVIMTSRKSILEEVMNQLVRFKLFDKEKMVCLSEECNLTHADMYHITTAHTLRAQLEVSQCLVNKIIQNGRREGFPRTCDIVFRVGMDTDTLYNLFTHPTEIISQELAVLSKNNACKALLWLCLFEGGELKIDTVTKMPQVHKDILEKAGLSRHTTYVQVVQTGNAIPQCYVQMESIQHFKILKFSHPSVLLAVAKLFAKENLGFLIANCSFKLIVDIFSLDSDAGRNHSTTIGLDNYGQILLARRFLSELEFGNIYGICSHVAFSEKYFVKIFLDMIKQIGKPKLIYKRDNQGLSFLYWSVWNVGEHLCAGIIEAAYFCTKKNKTQLEDISRSIIGASVSGNSEALSILCDLLPPDKFKYYLARMKSMKGIASQSNGAFSSILALAFHLRNTACVVIIVKKLSVDIQEWRYLLNESLQDDNSSMFEAIFWNIPCLKDLLQLNTLKMPLFFKKIIANIVSHLAKNGAQMIFKLSGDCYEIHIIKWFTIKWNYFIVKLKSLFDNSYEAHITPSVSIYDKIKLGYCPQAELYEAVIADLIEVVELLLVLGIDPNIVSLKHGESVLAAGCKLKKLELVKCLLRYGAQVTCVCCTKNCACAVVNIDVVHYLLDNEINCDIDQKHWAALLQVASKKRDISVIELLIKGGVDINTQGNNFLTPLGVACTEMDENMVKQLIELGADTNLETGMSCKTPLEMVCRESDGDAIAKILLENKAKVDIRSHSGLLLIEHACESGNEKILRLLARNRTDIYAGDDEYEGILNIACRKYTIDVVKILLSHMPHTVNVVSGPNRMTPLYVACCAGRTDVVQLLLDYYASTTQVCKDGRPLLHTVCQDGSQEIVHALLNHRVDINQSYKGETSLSIAVSKNRCTVVEMLCKNGANVNITMRGQSPLHIACSAGHNDIATCLLRHGASVNAQTMEMSETPLYLACFHSKIAVVETLIQFGADINKLAGRWNESPLLAACENGDKDIVELLHKKGADMNQVSGTMNYTPLMYLCRKYKLSEFSVSIQNDILEMIKLLLGLSANVNVTCGKDNECPLTIAQSCTNNQMAIVLCLHNSS